MERKLINMHIHTSSSDGQYDINTLWKKIKQTNLKAVSITDHDTVDAYNLVNFDSEVMLINGCEFSSNPTTSTYGARLHILGYDMNLKHKALKELIKKKREENAFNFLLQLEYLKKDYGISFSNEEIDKIMMKKDFGRPDIARLLIVHKKVHDFDEAFDKYLIAVFEKSKSIRKRISSEEIFDVIKKTGGFISIAHIISNCFNDEEMEHFLEYCKYHHVDAIELYHPSHSQKYMEYLLQKIKKYNFLISGGTDYHGPNIKPERFLEDTTTSPKIKNLSLYDEIIYKKNH